jgi:serine/threonine protein kinase
MSYGIDYLHSREIVHGDLKSANVLLDKEGHAKIGDFGGAKIKRQGTLNTTVTLFGQRACGTLNYLAPELLQEVTLVQEIPTGFSKQAKSSKASDMYSLGMLFFETATRRVPFGKQLTGDTKIPISEFKRQVLEENLQETPNPRTPVELKEVIYRCWSKERPKITEVLTKIKAEANKLAVDFENELIPKLTN